RLDASEAARVRSPQVLVGLVEGPAPGESTSAVDVPAYAHERPDDAEAVPPYTEDAPAYAAEPDAAAAAELPSAPEPVAELPGASTEILADPFADDGAPDWRPDEWSPDQWTPQTEPEPFAAATAPEPFAPAEQPVNEFGVPDPADQEIEYPMWDPDPDPDPVPVRAMPADGAEEMENADTELMPPPYQTATTGTEVSQNSLIMAVVCQYGHASAQNATTCRICGSPIAPQGPQLLPRPVMALLRASNGTTTEVDRTVLIGRAPSAQRSSSRSPRLMTVPSPGQDISRTHLEVAPEGWTVVVTDLHSTNGTILVRPGGVDRQPLPAGEAVPVELGSVVELGDGISVLIDFPQ
ncbi:MAG TPA: FHA domain-containing protein, partial [Propionibacteriaceae bacterium]|nr:FHA domain-containing protein [Propionibacteriaceae bacterium]